MVDFHITNELSNPQIADVTDLLRKPRLWIPTEKDYPSHRDWLDKSEAQLASGSKRAMTAYMGSKAIGTVIYQRDPQSPSNLEIRNISVSPDARGRYVGAFLLRNAEVEAVQHDFPGVERISVDTKATNVEMINFLLSQGYEIEDIKDLYGVGTGLDAVVSKSVTK